MIKTTEELTIENENLKQGNIKVWEQLEKSTEILSHHEAYISLLEEENEQLKELLKRCKRIIEIDEYVSITGAGRDILWDLLQDLNQVLGEE